MQQRQKNNKVLSGFLDNPVVIRKIIKLLKLRKIKSVNIKLSFFDMEIVLSGDYIIRTFSARLHDKQWIVYRPDGLSFTASTVGNCTIEE